MQACRVCHNSQTTTLTVGEMMFGTRQVFEYRHCSACGAYSLAELPPDMSVFYPPDYYSLTRPNDSALIAYVKRARGRQALGDKSIVGWAITRLFGAPNYDRWAKLSNAGRDARILDIGAGGGARVFNMTEAGFDDVLGVEPYLGQERVVLGNGSEVIDSSSRLPTGAFDLVMMHHSYEHVTDPIAQAAEVHRLLKPGGTFLFRIPVADSYAAETFGPDWVQWDAPRHVVLHTRRSIDIVAAETGFTVDRIECDSTAFQFWGSEMYQKDIPLRDQKEYLKSHRLFPGSLRMLRLGRRARVLNAEGRGDQAAFYLRKEKAKV